MTMIEKIARAIASHAYDGGAPDDVVPIIATRAQWQEWATKRARAAVEAMREPTGEMRAALTEAIGENAMPGEVWAAAIDAAMKE